LRLATNSFAKLATASSMPTPLVRARSASGNRRKAQEQEMAPANHRWEIRRHPMSDRIYESFAMTRSPLSTYSSIQSVLTQQAYSFDLRFGGAGQAPRRNAAAKSTKTEKLSGAFTPNDRVIAPAKTAQSAALANATGRRNMPRMRVIPNTNSATVAMIASAGARALGKKLFTLAVYSTK